MSSVVVEGERFSLSVGDWVLAVVLCVPTSLMLSLEVGLPLAAMLGEASVYFAFMVGLAYSFGRSRWQKAAHKPKAGRWAFRTLVVVFAGGAFVAAGVKALGQSAAEAGTEHLLRTTSALRTVLDSGADHEQIRREFVRVASEQTAAAAAAPRMEQPFRTVGAELAISIVRPQLDMITATVELAAFDVLASATLADAGKRAGVLKSANSLIASFEATRTAITSIEERADAALKLQPVSGSARAAFLHPLKQLRAHGESMAIDPALANWARAVVGLYTYLDAHADAWTIDAEGVLRADGAVRDEISTLLDAVTAAREKIT